ncbi:serine aminopeptidase S33 family [Frondihabitans sp. PhB188]|uniref:alpha/beta hydrolase family protein n=1 Tax=Frondihabitans sp. PhB188 TaxID=2485200 RepID=UPI000F48ACCB|nr:alpha/beta fold hydrolase [Frondihabitans sp. PhB188]ROQ41098.1 serine aminopeptidase S33 family [Frondihabitans sp. PhB188]
MTPDVHHSEAVRRAPKPVARLVGTIAAISAGGAAVAAVAGFAGLAYAVARFVVTPAKSHHERLRVVAVDRGSATVSLESTPDTRLPGRYGFHFDDGRGYARLGDVISDDGRIVVRHIEAVDEGDLSKARRGGFLGWYYRRPADLGLPFTDVEIATPIGPAPAWLVPPVDAVPTHDEMSDRWAVVVHGRGVVRAETLRGVPAFREEGYATLVVSYRNDGEAPHSDDHRYGLGLTEWADVEAAVDYAVEHGATSVVLMGWSMGGALVLQTALRSKHRGLIDGLVLESPVVDWRTVLTYQGDHLHLPRSVQRAVFRILGGARLSTITGQSTPIDFDALDLVLGATKLTAPILLLHSDDDGFVPSTASRALAEARPDLVDIESYSVARHTKLWNVDPERFDQRIRGWLRALPARSSAAPSSGRTATRGRRSAADRG